MVAKAKAKVVVMVKSSKGHEGRDHGPLVGVRGSLDGDAGRRMSSRSRRWLAALSLALLSLESVGTGACLPQPIALHSVS